MLFRGPSPPQGPPGGAFSPSCPGRVLQGRSMHSERRGARGKRGDITPFWCVRRRGEMGHQRGKEVQRSENNPGHQESHVCAVPAEHPSSPATQACGMWPQRSSTRTPVRSPSCSPFPHLINEAALKAILCSVQIQKTPAGPRDGARRVAMLITDMGERVAAPAKGGNQPFQGKEEKRREIRFPLFLPRFNKQVGKTS